MWTIGLIRLKGNPLDDEQADRIDRKEGTCQTE